MQFPTHNTYLSKMTFKEGTSFTVAVVMRHHIAYKFFHTLYASWLILYYCQCFSLLKLLICYIILYPLSDMKEAVTTLSAL